MKQLIAVLIMSLGVIQYSAQEYVFNKSFEELEEVLDALDQKKEDKSVFDFLIKYYEDQDKLEQRFVGVDNIDSPNNLSKGDFKMNRMVPFNLYPSPNKKTYNIDFYGEKGELRILDAHGNLVRNQSDVSNGKYLIKMRSFEKGLYYVQVVSNETSFKRRMLIE